MPPSSQAEAFAPQIPGLDFGLLAALTSGSVPLLGLPLQQPSSDIGAEGAEAGMPSGGDQLSAEQQQALMALLQQQQSQFQLQQLFALNQHQHQLGQLPTAALAAEKNALASLLEAATEMSKKRSGAGGIAGVGGLDLSNLTTSALAMGAAAGGAAAGGLDVEGASGGKRSVPPPLSVGEDPGGANGHGQAKKTGKGKGVAEDVSEGKEQSVLVSPKRKKGGKAEDVVENPGSGGKKGPKKEKGGKEDGAGGDGMEDEESPKKKETKKKGAESSAAKSPTKSPAVTPVTSPVLRCLQCCGCALLVLAGGRGKRKRGA